MADQSDADRNEVRVMALAAVRSSAVAHDGWVHMIEVITAADATAAQ
jgi:hypothetical protein